MPAESRGSAVDGAAGPSTIDQGGILAMLRKYAIAPVRLLGADGWMCRECEIHQAISNGDLLAHAAYCEVGRAIEILQSTGCTGLLSDDAQPSTPEGE